METTTNQMLTVDGVAARLAISRRTVWRLVEAGLRPVVRLRTRARGSRTMTRVHESDLAAYIQTLLGGGAESASARPTDKKGKITAKHGPTPRMNGTPTGALRASCSRTAAPAPTKGSLKSPSAHQRPTSRPSNEAAITEASRIGLLTKSGAATDRCQCSTCGKVFSTEANFDRHLTPARDRFAEDYGGPWCPDPGTMGSCPGHPRLLEAARYRL